MAGIQFNPVPTGVEAPPAAAVTPPVVTPPTERPAWLPENFKSPEDLAAAYKELQGKFTKDAQQPAAPPAAVVPDPAADAATAAAAEAAKAVAAVGLDINTYETEFNTSGKLSDESFAALEKAGIPRALADRYIADRVAEAGAVVERVTKAAGGTEQFGKMATWAAGKYDAAQLKAYNESVDSGDAARMEQAVVALRADYEKANPPLPRLLTPTAATPAGGASYESMAQYLTDMNNPLYAKDPAFRATVFAKLGRSKI